MNFNEFNALCSRGTIPEDLHPLLQAMIHDARGDWDTVHSIAQKDYTSNGARVHAYLHREEGDLANAGYWYRQAGRSSQDRNRLSVLTDSRLNEVNMGVWLEEDIGFSPQCKIQLGVRGDYFTFDVMDRLDTPEFPGNGLPHASGTSACLGCWKIS
jgi:hypothetical protein